MVGGRRGQLDTALLLQVSDEREALERRSEINLPHVLRMLWALRVILDLVRAEQVHGQAREELLGDLNHIVAVSVGHVELAHGEFRVVGQVDALVTEVSANLVDTIDTSNNQLLFD